MAPRGGSRKGAGRRPGGGNGRAKSDLSPLALAILAEEGGHAEMKPERPETARQVIENNMAIMARRGMLVYAGADRALAEGRIEPAVHRVLYAEGDRFRLLAGKCAEALLPYTEHRLPLAPPAVEDPNARPVTDAAGMDLEVVAITDLLKAFG